MAGPKIGKIFEDRYLIEAELGAGGMGLVFRAHQVDADRKVALKFLHKESLSNTENIQRFYREFKLLSRLSHPHIMTLYGMALDANGVPYAVCEFLEGKTLKDLLTTTEAGLPWQRAVSICIQICAALQFAHEEGIVHRDLKPENIMLLDKPTADYVKLVDFGLSRIFTDDESDSQNLTQTGQLIGSSFYMSPEQMNRQADARSDIYSLACVLFELLSGECLFDADNAVDAIYRHCNEDPSKRINSINSRVPAKLTLLLKAMLAKDPKERPASAYIVARKLTEILDETGPLLLGDGAYPSTKKSQAGLLSNSIIVIISFLSVYILFSIAKEYSKEQTSRVQTKVELEQKLRMKRQEPESLLKLYLSEKEKTLGPDHPENLDEIDKLASLYAQQNRWAEAEQMAKRALDIRQKTKGPNHLDLAQSAFFLGSCLREQSKWAEAEKLFGQSWEIKRRVLGPNHPDVTSTAYYRNYCKSQLTQAKKKIDVPPLPGKN